MTENLPHYIWVNRFTSLTGASLSRKTASWLSISSPNSVFRRSPEFPTTAQVRNCRGWNGGFAGNNTSRFSSHRVLLVHFFAPLQEETVLSHSLTNNRQTNYTSIDTNKKLTSKVLRSIQLCYPLWSIIHPTTRASIKILSGQHRSHIPVLQCLNRSALLNIHPESTS